ncbi:MAG: hypothetical protein QOE77_644 [Blastocatellia bacterium]|jgi:hypothetical protein|nr:hypothetical protein [Blastocatellia bacterium]
MKYRRSSLLIGTLFLVPQISVLGQNSSWGSYTKTGDDAIAQKRNSLESIGHSMGQLKHLQPWL